MACYVPVIDLPYMLRGMLDYKTWAALMASGVINQSELSGRLNAGDFVQVPTINTVADFSRTDVTSSAAASATAAATQDDKAVVLRSHSLNSYTNYNEVSAGENFDALLSASVGEKLAKRVCSTIFLQLSAAADAIDSPSANCHVKDLGDAAVTVQALRQGKMKMGDAADDLTTLVMHSSVYSDLLYDMIATYKIDVVGGQAIIAGKLSGLLGIENLVITDLVRTQNTGTGTSTDDRFDTFMLGRDAIWFGYQASPEVKVFNNITVTNDPTYLRVNAHYVGHPRKMAWTGSTASPSDSDLVGSNYSQKSEDHREIKIVKIISNGGQYA